MHFQIGAFFAILLAVAPVVVGQRAPNGHQYIAPGPNDVRSPCPGLNSLANHGFLPRNGKDITVARAVKGLKAGLNVGADFTTAIGGLGTLSNPNPLEGTFTLDELRKHNFPIEHDASLSRLDFPSNNLVFNQNRWNGILRYYNGMTTTSLRQAERARQNRVNQCESNNPDCTFGARQLVLSTGETALYLSTMGNPTTGIAPLSYVKSLFEKERLPYELGWQKPVQETNLASLGAMVVALNAAEPMSLPEGLQLGAGSLKDVYELRDPITGVLINATCALAGTC